MNPNYLILANGKGQRFADAGFKERKPYIQLHGIPLYRHVINNYQIPLERLSVAFPVDSYKPSIECYNTLLLSNTSSPAESLSKAITLLDKLEYCDDQPLIVLDCDCWLVKSNIVDHLAIFEASDITSIVYQASYEGHYSHFTTPSANENNRLVEFVKYNNPSFINPGCYIFRNLLTAKSMVEEFLSLEFESNEEETLPKLLEYFGNTTAVIKTNASFVSVGTPEEYKDQLT